LRRGAVEIRELRPVLKELTLRGRKRLDQQGKSGIRINPLRTVAILIDTFRPVWIIGLRKILKVGKVSQKSTVK
jgi:hypothetical protein